MTGKNKTEPNLIHSYNCSENNIKRDFESVLDDYNRLKETERKLIPRMIVQSFSPDEDITPEQAHEYGKEFADNYLKGDFQYILATHYDTDHIHNHIVFNDINFKELNIYDSSRENTLHRMRNENDLVAEKYGLQVIEKIRKKHHYLSHKEYVVRSKGTSFKEKTEHDIDSSILDSDSYDDFLKSIESKGYEVKKDKHLAVKSPTGKRFMRMKSLGFNYLENSIKHRIENKDYIPLKTKVMTRDWINKDQEKFKNNIGLRRWASVQNINYLHEVNKILSKDNISLEQFTQENEVKENFEKNLESKLSRLDNQVFKLEGMSNCFDDYQDSYHLIIGFKKLDTQQEKEDYKEENYSKFKKHDMSKKNMNILKKGYRVNNAAQLKEKITSLNDERNLIYESVNLNKDIEQEKRIVQKIKKIKDKQKNNEMEL